MAHKEAHISHEEHIHEHHHAHTHSLEHQSSHAFDAPQPSPDTNTHHDCDHDDHQPHNAVDSGHTDRHTGDCCGGHGGNEHEHGKEKMLSRDVFLTKFTEAIIITAQPNTTTQQKETARKIVRPEIASWIPAHPHQTPTTPEILGNRAGHETVITTLTTLRNTYTDADPSTIIAGLAAGRGQQFFEADQALFLEGIAANETMLTEHIEAYLNRSSLRKIDIEDFDTIVVKTLSLQTEILSRPKQEAYTPTEDRILKAAELLQSKDFYYANYLTTQSHLYTQFSDLQNRLGEHKPGLHGTLNANGDMDTCAHPGSELDQVMQEVSAVAEQVLTQNPENAQQIQQTISEPTPPIRNTTADYFMPPPEALSLIPSFETPQAPPPAAFATLSQSASSEEPLSFSTDSGKNTSRPRPRENTAFSSTSKSMIDDAPSTVQKPTATNSPHSSRHPHVSPLSSFAHQPDVDYTIDDLSSIATHLSLDEEATDYGMDIIPTNDTKPIQQVLSATGTEGAITDQIANELSFRSVRREISSERSILPFASEFETPTPMNILPFRITHADGETTQSAIALPFTNESIHEHIPNISTFSDLPIHNQTLQTQRVSTRTIAAYSDEISQPINSASSPTKRTTSPTHPETPSPMPKIFDTNDTITAPVVAQTTRIPDVVVGSTIANIAHVVAETQATAAVEELETSTTVHVVETQTTEKNDETVREKAETLITEHVVEVKTATGTTPAITQEIHTSVPRKKHTTINSKEATTKTIVTPIESVETDKGTNEKQSQTTQTSQITQNPQTTRRSHRVTASVVQAQGNTIEQHVPDPRNVDHFNPVNTKMMLDGLLRELAA